MLRRSSHLTSRGRSRAWHGSLAVVIGVVVVGVASIAASPLAASDELVVSPDVTLRLGGPVVADEGAVGLDSAVPVVFGGLPPGVAISALHLRENGAHLVSFDRSTRLPGGLIADPRDVVEADGGVYSMFFPGSQRNLPRGSSIDGFSLDENNGDFYFSLDVTADLGAGLLVSRNDIVRWDGSEYSLSFDSGKAGVPRSMNLDALALEEPGVFAVSFDVSGELGGFHFDDEDILHVSDGGDWLQLTDTSVHIDWRGGDADAIARGHISSHVIFADGFETGDTSAW